jgi:excisionase family DNA binding protein
MQLLSHETLADQLGVSHHTIRRWHRDGVITPTVSERSVVRFDFDEVIAGLKKRAARPKFRTKVLTY